MLDDRKAAILRAVIEGYIETAQPVGSSRVAKTSSVAASSATVRNEMVALEQEGYLQQPHTSAGHVPTDKGYRFFVDSLAEPRQLGPEKSTQVAQFFDHAHGELERMLADTSRLLTTLTDHTAVVVGPTADAATIRSVQLVGLAPTVALVVVVLSNGVVEKHTIELPAEASELRLETATRELSKLLVGGHLGAELSGIKTGDPKTDEIISTALRAVAEVPQNRTDLFVDGTSKMAQAFDAIDTVRGVLSIMEKQFVIVSLIRDLLARGSQVTIGAEIGMQPLAECSIVLAPYEVEGEPAGSIAVLGPTRMDYGQALAAVAVVGNKLGRRLSEG